ncbi:S1 family peptidase [Dongshaea marina]|uniref:S1 family peptidase n=1 Tax=Dongshaea marina TaxID=2047966 RepID=UPI000D3ECBA6|nr:S1 family peptidase [Dongshaea marina]
MKEKVALWSPLYLLLIFPLFTSHALALIDNGTQANPDKAPFNSIVMLYNSIHGGSTCTGTFIQDDLILTAGHCVTSKDPSSKQMIIASPSTIQLYEKANWIPLPKVASIQTPFDGKLHDFALIKLAEPVANHPYVPLEMNLTETQMLLAHQTLLIAGYGRDIGFANQDTNPGYKLLEGKVKITSDTAARKTLKEGSHWLAEQEIPDGSLANAQNYNATGLFAACGSQATDFGDSGSAVFNENADGSYSIVGVTSRGLTIKTAEGYISYNHCIDSQMQDQSPEKISIFSDLTSGSSNYPLLQDSLNQLS